MASKSDAVWAIDIGNNSLKALHLSAASGVVEVIGFDNIQHGKILTGSGVKDAERDELVALSLRQFVTQNALGKDDIVVSVPSQNSFARFVNLPPVEPKRIPEIVKFEAVQQIPFDINDVQWDWQLITEPGTGENKVGIFAIKNDVVNSVLEHFGREDVRVSYVQMAPMALYNYVLYDRPDLSGSDTEAAIVLNIGAENTDLVVCTKSTVWQRSISMGGNAFTKAIADTFKLNFEKAEKLKRTAAMSKYARQIFQAMGPVFTDLASEVQRSLGFYSSSNPNTKLLKVIALGGGTKMRGLLKYLQQSLQIPIERPDSFKRLSIRSDVSAAKFHESVSDFGVVYGLALQGLGLGRIESNLLPRSIARSAAWAGKAKYFTAAACILLLVSVLCFARTLFDKGNYSGKVSSRRRISSIIDTARTSSENLNAQRSKGPHFKAIIEKEFGFFGYRDVIPLLHQTIISALPNEKNNPEQKELYRAFADNDAEGVEGIDRKERKQIFVTSMSVRFAGDIAATEFGKTDFLKRQRIAKRSKKPAVVSASEEYAKMMEQARAKYVPEKPRRVPRRDTKKVKEEVEVKAGFVVTIAGYSPYKEIGELLDPSGVEDDQSKWGFVTRLSHLETIADGNSPFKLYNKTEAKHFRLPTGEVGLLGSEMPAGIGFEDVRIEKAKVEPRHARAERTDSGKQVLIDPMTKEIISVVAELNEDGSVKTDRLGKEVYKVNDHWFILYCKFIWKDAPKENIANGVREGRIRR